MSKELDNIDLQIDINLGIIVGVVLGICGNVVVSALYCYVLEPLRVILSIFILLIIVVVIIRELNRLKEKRCDAQTKENADDLQKYPVSFWYYRKIPEVGWRRLFNHFKWEVVWMDRKTGKIVDPPYTKYLELIEKSTKEYLDNLDKSTKK